MVLLGVEVRESIVLFVSWGLALRKNVTFTDNPRAGRNYVLSM